MPVPAFTSDVLPTNHHAYAADALQRAVTADAVRQVFADVRAMELVEQTRREGVPVFGYHHHFAGWVGGGGTIPADREIHVHGADNPRVQALCKDFFGRNLSAHEIGMLVGAQDGFHVVVREDTAYTHDSKGNYVEVPGLHFEVHGPITATNPGPGYEYNAQTGKFDETPAGQRTTFSNGYDATRVLYRELDGSLTMGNMTAYVQPGLRRSGVALHVFRDQVQAAVHFGIARLKTHANGDPNGLHRGGASGFYAWARMGYDGALPGKFTNYPKIWAGGTRGFDMSLPGQFRGAKTISDLMAMPGGAAWWKLYGSDFEGTFDTSPGSRSLQILQAYLDEKGVGWETKLDTSDLVLDASREHSDMRAAVPFVQTQGDDAPYLTDADEAILDHVWVTIAKAYPVPASEDEERMQVADAPHEHQFVAERCLVCGCGMPRNPHENDLPILQPDVPVTVAPHTDEKQSQLALTECPSCGKSAQDVTDTGYWYTGMVCPVCGHEFTTADERTAMLDLMRELKAEVTRAIDY